jgi:hypothetical protein
LHTNVNVIQFKLSNGETYAVYEVSIALWRVHCVEKVENDYHRCYLWEVLVERRVACTAVECPQPSAEQETGETTSEVIQKTLWLWTQKLLKLCRHLTKMIVLVTDDAQQVAK